MLIKSPSHPKLITTVNSLIKADAIKIPPIASMALSNLHWPNAQQNTVMVKGIFQAS